MAANYLPTYLSMAFVDLGRFFSFFICTQSAGLLGQGISPRKVAPYTYSNTNTEWTHTDIHDSSGILTHDPTVRAGEDGSCLRLRGHCDRLTISARHLKFGMARGTEETYGSSQSGQSEFLKQVPSVSQKTRRLSELVLFPLISFLNEQAIT
jgi:hypothetical protein